MPPQISRRDFLKLGALLALANVGIARSLGQVGSATSKPSRPNILIVILDALSAKNMSLYGYSRQTTPNISRFAERATVYHHHYSGGNFTTTGTASLLTGTLPWTHHAFNLQGMVNDFSISRNLFHLSPSGTYTSTYTHNLLALTLLYQFRDALNELGMPRKLALKDLEYSDLVFKNDYNTSFMGENLILRGDKRVAASLFLSPLYHTLSRRTAQQINYQYKDQFPFDVPNQDDVYFTLEESIDWAIQQVKTLPQPYLAYFHFLPPHGPYTPRYDFLGKFKNDSFSTVQKPESFASEGFKPGALDRERRLYDEYLAYADSEFGRLVDAMGQSGAFDNTYLILTSDHGELFERGIRGHVTPVLYEPLVHIPLIISKPGVNAHEDVFTRTSCVDLEPTIQSIYGLSVSEWSEGQVLPTFTTQAPGERPIFAMDSKDSPKHAPVTKGSFMVIDGNYKLLHYMDTKALTIEDELYDLEKDPEETENLIKTRSSTAAELQNELLQQLNQANQAYITRG
jgi:arylsulfatase A-like enzyme